MKLRAAEIRYAWFERFAMRLLLAWVVKGHILGSLAHLSINTPNGLARFIDLRFLLDPQVFTACRYVLYAALVLYVLRIGWSFVLPYLALLSIAQGTIINSSGAIAHYMQIVSLVLCAQTAAHFYNKFRRGPRLESEKFTDEDRVVFWSQQAIVATYLVSALTKLIHTGGRWFIESPLIAVQIVKTTDQDYFDRLDPSAYNSGVLNAEWIVRHPLLIALVLGFGLILELTTPLSLLGRRWALFYGVSLVLFHETVDRVMKLQFPLNEDLIWIYLVNVPVWAVFLALWPRRRLPA